METDTHADMIVSIAIGRNKKGDALMRTEKFYIRRLTQYFDTHYSQYENTAEWYNNPAVNQWKCDIPALGFTILFTCDENGNVTETRTAMK